MDRPELVVRILYTNHRGETAWREILPKAIRFGASEWHPGEQWLLEAWDYEKKSFRTFAMQDIESWEPLPVGAQETTTGEAE